FHTGTETTKVLGEMVRLTSNTWRFPLGPRPDGFTYVSAQGNPVRKMSWRGPPDLTPGCVEGPDHCSDIEVKPEFSDRRVGLVEMGYGERMYSWAMTWTPKVGKPW